MCDAGAVSRAAARLAVKHSTVRRRIAAREATPGTALFDRDAGSCVLTAAGRELLPGSVGVAARIAVSPPHVEGRDEAIEGEVRLTSTDTLLHGMPMPDGSATAKAIDYRPDRWPAPARFIDDGDWPNDNWVKNQIRPIVMADRTGCSRDRGARASVPQP